MIAKRKHLISPIFNEIQSKIRLKETPASVSRVKKMGGGAYLGRALNRKNTISTFCVLILCINITHKKKWTEILRLDALCPIMMRQTASDHIFSPLSHIKKRACMMNYEWPRAYSEVHHICQKLAGWNFWFFPRFFSYN